MPKTAANCKEAIAKQEDVIQKEETKLQDKENNKSVALGTSKINYMDPRITISWCKNKEVAIEKIFPVTLRNKFAWAMPTDPNWQF